MSKALCAKVIMVYHSKLTQVVAAICGIIIGCIVLAGLYAVSSLTLIYLGLIDSDLHSNGWLNHTGFVGG